MNKTKKNSETANMEVYGELDKKLFHVFNLTDNVYATRKPLSFIDAMIFIHEFPKQFLNQAYYITSNKEKINPENVVLMLQPLPGI